MHQPGFNIPGMSSVGSHDDGFSVNSTFFGEKNLALLRKMKENQERLSTELTGKQSDLFHIRQRTFKSPQLNESKANYIDFNKKISPLARILGNDKSTGYGSFRKQSIESKLLLESSKNEHSPSSPRDRDNHLDNKVFLTENVHNSMLLPTTKVKRNHT